MFTALKVSVKTFFIDIELKNNLVRSIHNMENQKHVASV